jgi:hypothetical protein
LKKENKKKEEKQVLCTDGTVYKWKLKIVSLTLPLLSSVQVQQQQQRTLTNNKQLA